MVELRVVFKPNTSEIWASEKLTNLGLIEIPDDLLDDEDFILTGDCSDLSARVQVSEENERDLAVKIRMISPQVVSVTRS